MAVLSSVSGYLGPSGRYISLDLEKRFFELSLVDLLVGFNLVLSHHLL